MTVEQAGESGAAGGVEWDELLEQLTDQPVGEGWVTLEEASSAAGVARSTLRSWYRAGHIPSRMMLGRTGPSGWCRSTPCSTAALRSSRLRRQIEQGRSLAAEVDRLRQRVEVMERLLGLR